MILYAGSYTTLVGPGLKGTGAGIYCFNFNEATGDLKLLSIEENTNTSFLAIAKSNRFLYSFNEVNSTKQPKVLAYKINKDCSLTLLNEQPILGGLPCHLNLIDENTLVVVCYETGNIHVYPIGENGCLNTCSQIIKHSGSSVNKERQESSHTHMVAVYNNQVFVPDLGLDEVIVYNIEKEDGVVSLINNYSINTPIGGGARHLVFHPNNEFAFLINELTGVISILKKNSKQFELVENVDSLPKTYAGIPSGAAIQISNCGTFLYCSNRGSETITIFKFNKENEALKIVGYQDTFGLTPRDFILSPEGKWLLVSNQDSHSIEVFKIDGDSGLLMYVNSNKEVQSVVCLKWM